MDVERHLRELIDKRFAERDIRAPVAPAPPVPPEPPVQPGT